MDFKLPEDRVEAYHPNFKGTVPPRHLQRPKQMLPPRPDHRMLGAYIKNGGDQVRMMRCPTCNVKYAYPNKPCNCK